MTTDLEASRVIEAARTVLPTRHGRFEAVGFFDLVTGECLTDPSVRLPVHRTWVAGGVVHVEDQPRASAAPAAVPDPEVVVAG